jgi:hypothetical protein
MSHRQTATRYQTPIGVSIASLFLTVPPFGFYYGERLNEWCQKTGLKLHLVPSIWLTPKAIRTIKPEYVLSYSHTDVFLYRRHYNLVKNYFPNAVAVHDDLFTMTNDNFGDVLDAVRHNRRIHLDLNGIQGQIELDHNDCWLRRLNQMTKMNPDCIGLISLTFQSGTSDLSDFIHSWHQTNTVAIQIAKLLKEAIRRNNTPIIIHIGPINAPNFLPSIADTVEEIVYPT